MLRRCRAHPLHLARIHTTSVRRHASSSASTRTNTRLTAPGESGMMFEKAVIRSLETAAHLHVVAHCETTQADGGVDFRARWPGIPAQVCVQCKSSSRTFPVNLIREFEGTLIRERASSSSVVGIAVSCQPYSRAALRWLMQSSIPMAVCIVDAEREPVDAVQYWQHNDAFRLVARSLRVGLSTLTPTSVRFILQAPDQK